MLNRTEAIRKSGCKTKPHRNSWVVEDDNKIIFLGWLENYNHENQEIMVLDIEKWNPNVGGYKASMKTTALILDTNVNKKIQMVLQKMKVGTGGKFKCAAVTEGVVSMLYDIELFRDGQKIMGKVIRSERI